MKLGDVVIYKQGNGEFHYNNSQYHPAVITRVNDDGSYNIQAFFDAYPVQHLICVPAGSTQDDHACVMTVHDYEEQIAGPFPTSGGSE